MKIILLALSLIVMSASAQAQIVMGGGVSAKFTASNCQGVIAQVGNLGTAKVSNLQSVLVLGSAPYVQGQGLRGSIVARSKKFALKGRTLVRNVKANGSAVRLRRGTSVYASIAVIQGNILHAAFTFSRKLTASRAMAAMRAFKVETALTN